MSRKIAVFILGCVISLAGFFFILSSTIFPKLAEISLYLSPLYSVSDAGEIEMTLFRALSAVIGGIMIGWGITIMYISEYYTKRARLYLLIAMIFWFITDSIGSLLNELEFNIILNGVFLIFGLIVIFVSKPEDNESE